MSRVALCLSGQPRYALESFPYIKKFIIDPNKADVFIHMTFQAGYVEKSHLDNGCCHFPENYDKQVIEAYQPKSHLVEPQQEFNDVSLLQIPACRLARLEKMNAHKKTWTTEQHRQHALKQTISMFYSIFKVTELKERFAQQQKIVYDYVIRIRFDAVPQKELRCADYDPHFIYFQHFNQPDHLIFDWINFGSNCVMNVFGSIFLHLEYLNSYRFFPKAARPENTWEDSDICGSFNEGMIRDIMHRFNISSRSFDVNLKLGVEFFKRKRILVITSTYNDEVVLQKWIHKVPQHNNDKVVYEALVYEKDDSIDIGNEVVVNSQRIKICNLGRCDYAFFYHIVKNFHNLEAYDHLVFTKCNWAHENTNFFQFLSTVHQSDFADFGNRTKLQVWNRELLDVPKDSEHFEVRIDDKIPDTLSETAWDWYHQLFPSVDPPRNLLPVWVDGPIFSVSPRLIKRHSLDIYNHMLSRFDPRNWNCELGLKNYGTMTKFKEDMGKRYHEHCLRFYRVLFTHNIDNAKFVIRTNDEQKKN